MSIVAGAAIAAGTATTATAATAAAGTAATATAATAAAGTAATATAATAATATTTTTTTATASTAATAGGAAAKLNPGMAVQPALTPAADVSLSPNALSHALDLQTGKILPKNILDPALSPAAELPRIPKKMPHALDLQTGKVLPEEVICRPLGEFLKENCPEISPAERSIYENAGLKGEMVKGRPCLTQSNINLDYKDANGMTNSERMENGLAPINPKDGLPYELHHVGQKNNAPLAELTHGQHMSPETNKTLHPIRVDSEVDHGSSWRDIRVNHWEARAEQFSNLFNHGV